MTAALILSESGANCVSTMMRPSLPTAEGDPIPPNTLAELRRDMERRRLVRDQIRQIEAARLERLEPYPRMPNMSLTRAEAADTAAYIGSLRK